MHPQHTVSALAYIRKKREQQGKYTGANWFDVADAYDAGMKHALEAEPSAKRAMAELKQRVERLQNSASGSTK